MSEILTVATGTVDCRIAVATNDSADTNTSFDTLAPEGFVYLTARRNAFPAQSEPAIVIPDTISLAVNSQGWASIPTEDGQPTSENIVELPVSEGMTWQVSFDLWLPPYPWQHGTKKNRLRVEPFDVPVIVGRHTHIADYLPMGVDPGKGTVWVKGDRGAGISGAIEVDGTLVLETEDGELLAPVALPASSVPGPAAKLSIGAVTAGTSESDFAANVTGSEGDYKLNLKLPRGLKGNDGAGIPGGGAVGQVPARTADGGSGWVDASTLVPGATPSQAGLLTASDKARLDALPDAAAVSAAANAALAAAQEHAMNLSKRLLPNRFVEGVPLWSMGHSYTMYPYPYGTQGTGEYYMRVGQRLNMGKVTALGRSGTFAIDNFGRMISNLYDSGKGRWTPGSRGVCVLQNSMNELGHASAGAADFRTQWEFGIRGEVAAMRSQSFITAEQLTRTGTWTALTSGSPMQPKMMDGSCYFTSDAAATATFSVSGDEVSVVSIICLSSYTAAPVEVLCGGKVVATHDPKGKKTDYTDTVLNVAGQSYTPAAIRVTGLNATAGTTGAKTVTIRRAASASTGNAFISGVIIPSAKPPAVFLVKEPPRGGSAAAIYAANIAYYNGVLEAIASEFDRVWTVDFAPGWDNSTMIGSLDVAGGSFHPNDIGHSLMADHLTAAINQRITTWIDGVAVL